MTKNVELHPGTYRFALFYRARSATTPDETNKLVVYLRGTKPVTPKTAKLTMNDNDIRWRNRSFNFEVAAYGLYELTIAAEGCSDGIGGLFNDMSLTYVRRPYPEYNDPAPPVTN